MRIPAAICLAAAVSVSSSDSAVAQRKPAAEAKAEVLIRTPDNWAYGDTITVDDSKPFRIVARVLHPAGISEVLLNNRSVRSVADPENKKFSKIDTTVAPGSVTDVMMLMIVPIRGDTARFPYYTTLARRGPYSAPLIASKPPEEIPRTVEAKKPETQKTVPTMPACSWSSYKKRGIGYGVAGGAGLVIGASGQKAGFGLAAVAAIAAGIDGVVSANRSGCKSR